MANKISLANKYRPKEFSDVVEQDSIKTILLNQMQTDNLKHAYLFCGSAGTGKAQPLDSLILTPTGYVKMGDIKIGDKVIDGLGNETIVTDIFPQGIKPVYRVEFSDRTFVLCSDEHLWKVGEYISHKKQIEWSIITTNQILKNGVRKRHSSTETRLRYRVPLPIIDCWKDEDIIIDPYVLGVLIGDGSITLGAKFSNTELDIVHKVNSRLLKSGFELHKVKQSDETKCDVYNIVPINFTYTNQYHKTGFVNLLKRLDVCRKSIEKHIPKNYLYSSVETRIELLQGLFDTDGFVDSRKARSVFVFNTSSSQLSEDFAFLVRSLGGTDTVVRKPAGYKKNGIYVRCNDTYEHIIKLPDNILPFSSVKHTSKYRKPQNGPIRKITNIEYIGEQECQCIRVKSDDHTYITNNVTVTHNTTSARIIANMMNEGKGRIIELDCASHNGVDDMRNIIEECKSKPIQGKYKIFLLDEVHMLTVQAWNSLLKILEEPPEFVIFLFCTTDPQKIIGTVLSRVQRFNFQRISVRGIYNRLKYIIENENKERQFKQENIITYENEALKYIARLAKGGMRDSITTLEKCLDYNINLTLDNVLKVTSGSITENDMMKLTDCILQKDAKSALILFNEIYNSGIDISLFMKMYIEFIENCNKLLITSVIELTTLSDIAVNWLRERVQYRNIFNMILIDAGQMRLNYTSDDMKIIIESWLMKVCSW